MAKGELRIVRVKGAESVADGLTRHVDRQRMDQHMKACSIARWNGRHEVSPQIGDRA